MLIFAEREQNRRSQLRIKNLTLTVTVGADPCVRPDYRNVTTYVDVHRADAGVRPYSYGLR